VLCIFRFVTAIVFSISLSGMASAQTKKPPQKAQTVDSAPSNSLNAIDIKTLYKKIDSEVKLIKEDPFDSNSRKNKRTEIYDKYKNVIVFIPSDKHDYENTQNLTNLQYSDGMIRASISKPEYDLGYVTWYSSNPNGGSCNYGFDSFHPEGVNGYKLQRCGSDIGSASCKNLDDWIIVEVAGVDVDTARRLSGNLERYIKINAITDIYHSSSSGLGDYIGEGRHKCSGNKGDRYGISVNGFNYFYIDKTSGKRVLSFSD